MARPISPRLTFMMTGGPISVSTGAGDMAVGHGHTHGAPRGRGVPPGVGVPPGAGVHHGHGDPPGVGDQRGAGVRHGHGDSPGDGVLHGVHPGTIVPARIGVVPAVAVRLGLIMVGLTTPVPVTLPTEVADLITPALPAREPALHHIRAATPQSAA